MKQRTLLGAELNFLLESAALSAATRNCLVGAEGAAWGGGGWGGLCIAPSDPGEGSSVNRLDPLSGFHRTRAPFGPCLFLHLLSRPPLAGSSWPFHRHRPFPPLAPISPSPTVPSPSGLLCSSELPLLPFSPSVSLISFFLSSLPFLAPSCPLFRPASEAALLCPCIAALPPGWLRVARGTGLRQSPRRPVWGEPASPLPAAPSSPRSSRRALDHCTTFTQTLLQLVLPLEICSVSK